ncbi:MAG: aldo/keto reductase [Nitrospinae bacterium]|nr:aldo/keto reductase [Nitrospinota bacterium]
MIYDRIKGIDKDWSRITLGCWQIAPSGGWGDICPSKDAERVVQSALDHGITAFDTAEGYGDGESERRLGKALGARKDSVIIISKIWPDAELTLKAYQQRLEDSLKALGRDYVDLYLVHWPGSYFSSPDKSARLADIMNALKTSGKATTIGLSNFQFKDLTLLGDKLNTFSMNQVPYSLLDRAYEGRTLDLCKNADIPYMAFSPTAQGLLAKPMSREDLQMPTRKHHFLYQDQVYPHARKVWETVRDVAKEMGRKPVEVALAWVLARDNIFTAIVGSRKPEQVQEFVKSADLKLSPDQLQRLTAASDQFPMVKKGH